MSAIASPHQKDAAIVFRKLISLYLENRDLILMGGYVAGQDPDLDLAVQLWPSLIDHIRQNYDQKASFDESVKALQGLFEGMA
jgi:flagellum-specific ATP synthase